MGLAEALVPPVVAKAYNFARWLVSAPSPLSGGPYLDEQGRWDGADDLWPGEEYRGVVNHQIDETSSEPETIVSAQWGLRLPDGEIAWNSWNNISFSTPLDRVNAIATLQRTALDLGFAEDRVSDFLNYYGWVTRNQIAAVVYEDTGAYSLTDPVVSAAGAPEAGEADDPDERTPPNSHVTTNEDSAGDVRPRSVGGAT